MDNNGKGTMSTEQTFLPPSQLSDEQRRQNLAAMHSRIASTMSRVAADPKQPKHVRAANTRDAKAARTIAARLTAS